MRPRAPLACAVAVACLLACAAPTRPAPGSPDDRGAAHVASSGAFRFYSDPLMNLHDFLYERALAEAPSAVGAACVEALPEAQSRGWQAAEAYYRDHMASRHHRTDSLMVAVRYRLAGMAVDLVPEPVLAPVTGALDGAAPAYRACFWTEHDRRNRAWVAALLPLLASYEDTLVARLSRHYRHPWPDPIPVDVVGYASWGGANTVTDPHHIMISSKNDGYQGHAALEMVFHEASHTILGGGSPVDAALRAASSAHGERPPRDLWHALLFYTTGRTVQQLLAEHGVDGYNPYVYEQGLFERSWSAFREPIERHWRPYLDGAVDLDTAAVRLLDALRRP